MKTLFGSAGTIALMFGWMALNAQTNSIVPATNTAAATGVGSNSVAALSSASTNTLQETEIFSDRFDLDSRTRTAVYTGNVRVVDPRMKLTCDVMTGQMGDSTNKFRHVVAEGNVVIDALDNEGKPVRATSGVAEYDYRVHNGVTNEVVELSINPRVEQGSNVVTGKIIVWDRQRDTIRVEQSSQRFGSQGIFGGSSNKLISPFPGPTRTNR
jgi:lipopolysaccharide transport protein LptA